jgi:hypothetical protein
LSPKHAILSTIQIVVNTKEKISAWLAGPKDWESGLHLYLQYGKSPGLKTIFKASGETAYNREKLVEELEKLRGAGVATPAPVISNKKRFPESFPYGRTPPLTAIAKKKDTERQELEVSSPPPFPEEIKKLIQERSFLHAQLSRVKGVKERQEMAFSILELSDQITEMMDNKPLSIKKSTVIPKDPALKVRLLMNNRAYISKFKSDPKKADQVQARIQQNKLIENELSGMENREAEN